MVPGNAPGPAPESESGLPDAADLMSIVEQMPAALSVIEGADLLLFVQSAAVPVISDRRSLRGRTLAEAFPELVTQGAVQVCTEVYRTGQPFHAAEWRFEFLDPADGNVTERFLNWTVAPWRAPDGSMRGVITHALDVTEQVLARRAAERKATEAGQRYQQARDVVAELQQALLPAALPVLPRVDVAARYLVAGAEQSAGGDWFDVRPLPDGRVGLVVGDVVGHGVAAAAVMSQLRAVLAHALDSTGDPAAAVGELERFAESLPGARSASVVVAVLDPAAGTLDYLTRGHPAPVLVDAAGQGRQLLGSGAGSLGGGAGRPAQQTSLADGDVVVLFSDGLVERPHRPYTAGLDELTRLAEAATVGQLWPTGTSPSAVDRICSDAVDLLIRHEYHDDVTVLAVSLQPAIAPLHSRIPATAGDVPRLRSAVREWLTALRADPVDLLALELAVGEAVDNAVEHGFMDRAPGTLVVALRLRADGRVHVRVDDDGVWRPPRRQQERGTGLGLIASLGQDLAVDGRPTGTTVTFTRRLFRAVATATGARTAPPRLPPPGQRFDLLAIGNPPVVRVRGPVDAFAAETFRQQLTEHSRGGTVALTVDLTAVSHLTSTGLAALADLLRASERAGQPAVLVAPTGTPAAYALDLAGIPRRSARSFIPGPLDTQA